MWEIIIVFWTKRYVGKMPLFDTLYSVSPYKGRLSLFAIHFKCLNKLVELLRKNCESWIYPVQIYEVKWFKKKHIYTLKNSTEVVKI